MGPILKRIFKTLAKHAPGSSVRIGLFRACGFQIGEGVYLGEDVIVADAVGGVVGERGVFEEDAGLQAGPVLLADPGEFELLFLRFVTDGLGVPVLGVFGPAASCSWRRCSAAGASRTASRT